MERERERGGGGEEGGERGGKERDRDSINF
jgi:hypothetical protein